ncbi:hypothetical protein MTR67_009188 [Solanum verrucosum]|uniref:Uncharacterized protein n=1 Tax=Solanum verrucosum TaxID=315347 RepID=A0AAF0TH31_SOLVR|nr:hypothetical protein MTR67_009188 [Solanum verrucosum]
MPPPPAKWKGKCEFNSKACNNKLIGARNFVTTSTSPLDVEGHGTHTSSTAAGSFVNGANLLGNANGTAVGIAPRAHLAILDAAIEDGVDVLSISLGGMPVPFYDDALAIGAYSAIQKGIFVSCSAGNKGPAVGTLKNGAPWILTVAATTTDRKIRAVAVLGNGAKYVGESAFQPTNFSGKWLPLVNANDCESLSTIDVNGKIVLCDTSGDLSRIEKGEAVKNAGGAAMILMTEKKRGYTTIADVHVLPATHGPFSPSPGILKPDISGPGINILAAWPTSVGELITSATSSTFNIISGTLMACPHLAGVAALLKSAHPNWSPAAIKSAIMTTADIINLKKHPIEDERLNPANLFTIGSGNVNPSRASDPGLIYDIHPEDYVPYLCGLKYTDQQVSSIVRRKVHCTSSIAEAELNYPSFSISSKSGAQTYIRTVTNVGEANSTYTVEVCGLNGVKVAVNPITLKFSALNQKASYNVTVKDLKHRSHSQGYITWSSGRYSVRSPIQIFPHLSF